MRSLSRPSHTLPTRRFGSTACWAFGLSRWLMLVGVCGCLADGVPAADAGGSATAPLTAEQASDLVSKATGAIALDSLATLTADAALRLAGHDQGLSLDGLSSLDTAAAQALAMHGRLDDVDPASVDIDAILAKLNGLFGDGGDGEVDLDGVLNGIESLLADLPTDTDGEDAAGAADGGSDPWLSLGGLKTLSPGVASALAMHDGPLLLDGLTEISPEVARSLATHSGELSLAGLKSLSDAARAALATHEGPVVLPDALVTTSGGN